MGNDDYQGVVPLKRFDEDYIARQLKAAIPEVEEFCARMDEAKRVSRATLDLEITV